ncbi:hypothetical protein H4582DRAFT_1808575 [Lactarius indigo]|nr:hypothetical protein H4582DRAFT_1808575 [Lactarius indigo]
MSHELRVLIRDCEDDPIAIWDTLKASFVQQRTAPRFNAYHTLLSTQKDNSESLESLINKVDEQIRVIKSLSPSSFTLDNLYDELAVMAIIRALPQSFDEVVRTISVLDKFDKQSVIQSLRNMDQTRSNLSGTSSAFSASSTASKSRPKAPSTPHSTPSTQSTQSSSSSRPNATSALAWATLRPNASSRTASCARSTPLHPPQLHLPPSRLSHLQKLHSPLQLHQQVPYFLLSRTTLTLPGMQTLVPQLI